jgi:cell division septum initiation protein DivIVA
MNKEKARYYVNMAVEVGKMMESAQAMAESAPQHEKENAARALKRTAQTAERIIEFIIGEISKEGEKNGKA